MQFRLSRRALYALALIAMVICHIQQILVISSSFEEWFGWSLKHGHAFGNLLEDIGRITFPIFAYFIAEGWRRTRNQSKYLLRLLVFAVVSEFAYDWANFHGSGWNSVAVTLLCGALALWIYDQGEKNKAMRCLRWPLLAVLWAGNLFCKAEYGEIMIPLILGLYLLSTERKRLLWMAGILIVEYCGVMDMLMGVRQLDYESCFFTTLWALLAVVLLSRYDHKEQQIRPRYFVYAFYPLHLLVLGLINCVAFGAQPYML